MSDVPMSLLEGHPAPGWEAELAAPELGALLLARLGCPTPVLFLDEDGRPDERTWGRIAEDALRFAAVLRARGVAPGERVLLMLPTGPGFFHAFFGAIAAGAVPVPVYPPMSARQLGTYVETLVAILADSGAAALVAWREVRVAVGAALDRAPGVRLALELEDLEAAAATTAPLTPAPLDPGATAMLQYTSGSTDRPKGVALTHRNLLHNVLMNGSRPDDVVVSWLPLYHDMGLIGVVITGLYRPFKLVLLAPQHFLVRPRLWLEAASTHRATIMVAPNFGYALATARMPDDAVARLDLASVRMALCGAEPIQHATLEAFLARFAPAGFGPNVLMPVYGLAEATLAVTLPAAGQPPRVRWLDREALEAKGQARLVAPDAPGALPVYGLGSPLGASAVRVQAPGTGAVLPLGQVGEIATWGPSVMAGYHGNPAATATVLADGWLRTGDLGFIEDGMLYITGRLKDVIIRNGRNYYPQDLEAIVERHEGIRRGCVIAFGQPAADGAEDVVVLAETRQALDPAAQQALVREVERALQAHLGFKVARFELLPARTLLKTSSGKLRRKPTKEAYMAGTLLERREGLLELTRLVARSQLHWQARRFRGWLRR
jgi:acyl-CoA synthetase (AMP-forming)/AMP-acid ligase II